MRIADTLVARSAVLSFPTIVHVDTRVLMVEKTTNWSRQRQMMAAWEHCVYISNGSMNSLGVDTGGDGQNVTLRTF